MKFIIKFFFLFFIAETISVTAQIIQLGFRAESTVSKTTLNEERISPPNLFVTAGLKEGKLIFLKDLIAEIRFGKSFDPEYLSGYDVALFLKSHVITNSLYVACGINLHYNTGTDHNSSSVYVKEISLIDVGVGVNLPDNVFLELSRSFAVSNSTLGENDYHDLNGNLKRNIYNLGYLYKISIGLLFNL